MGLLLGTVVTGTLAVGTIDWDCCHADFDCWDHFWGLFSRGLWLLGPLLEIIGMRGLDVGTVVSDYVREDFDRRIFSADYYPRGLWWLGLLLGTFWCRVFGCRDFLVESIAARSLTVGIFIND